MDDSKAFFIVVIFIITIFIGLFAGYFVGLNSAEWIAVEPEQELIDMAIEVAELETGDQYTAISLYTGDREWVGFLLEVNNTGEFMYVGNNDFPSIFQGD